MSKKIKGLMEQELATALKGVDEFMVVSLMGMSGTDNNEFRGALLQKDIRIKVVKNSLAVRALGISGLKKVLTGPCAIAFGADNIVDLAKEIAAWDKKLDKLAVVGGYLEGEVLGAEAALALSKMLSRSEQQGLIVQLAQSPGSRLAGAVGAPAGLIAGCIKTLIENKEEAA